nr:MAG TPA: hypothetical protein [Caudoviricetes sp.]
MGDLMRDLGSLLNHLFTPETFGVVVSIGGISAGLLKMVKKGVASLNDKTLDKVNELVQHNSERINDIEKEILRLQLLEGMNSNRLSPSEIAYFYDRYKALGGNSFVTARVQEYLREWNEKRNN